MKKTSYKNKLPHDLAEALNEKREALRKLRFGTTGSRARNVREGSDMRKDIARIMTELNSKK